MPLFSVIIPTHNRPEFLPQAVASVLGQMFTDFELLIVNDGHSPVETLADRRIRVLNNLARGAVPARNTGVESAKGKYIAFIDDDDVWTDKNHLWRAAQTLNGGAAFLFADGMMRFPGENVPRLFNLEADVSSLVKNNTILVSTVCYRKSLHEQLGSFDEALPFYWDWDWYLRVARAGHVLTHHRRSVVDIRVHPQNMSGAANFKAREINLQRFADKHELGPLTLKNHADFVGS